MSVPLAAPKGERALSWSLQEVASSGEYIVSPKTAKTLQWLVNHALAESTRDDPGSDDPPEVYHRAVKEYKAVKIALETVRAEAHRDLGVTDLMPQAKSAKSSDNH